MKHIDNRKPQLKVINRNVAKNINKILNTDVVDKTNKEDVEKENNERKPTKVMTTMEKIEAVKDVLDVQSPTQRVKRVKKDKGLIERTESSKTILTEDNKELLND